MRNGMKHELLYSGKCSATDLAKIIKRLKDLYLWYDPVSETEMAARFGGHAKAEIDVLSHHGHVIAFGVCVPTHFGIDLCLFRHGTLVAPEYQSRGLYEHLLDEALSRHNPKWLGTRTQNPRVYETWWKRFGEALYPHPTRDIPLAIRQMGLELSGNDPTFDPETMVVRGVYREDRRTREDFRCWLPWVREFMESRLGMYDAMILVADTSPT